MSPGEASISCPPVPAPGRAPGLGVFAAAEDAARAAGRVVAEGGPGQPCSASQRSPGGRAAPPNMIQNRPSALAPSPGGGPGSAAPGPCRPGRGPAECLPPGPYAHGPRLQHQGCAAGSAAGSAPGTRGSLHSSRRTPCLNPKRTGPGASPARPEPQPQNSPPPPHRTAPLRCGGSRGLGPEKGDAPVLKSLEPFRVRARAAGLQSREVPDSAAVWRQAPAGSWPYSADGEMGSHPRKVTCQGYTTAFMLFGSSFLFIPPSLQLHIHVHINTPIPSNHQKPHQRLESFGPGTDGDKDDLGR
ncbi:nascent polypeptide-associated complex subunit alpha, muscle-specific form-like [Hylobates moloch]|uniref:nascent polypeptide-associated complex subunit alpha, muscle-specific form-like n=1 Tax=Hylobates moloch TaxID=81572 RepID=UPI0013641A4C|nr:nascent polypeptide-associated complex subunit alpha, muscle-specific form-like [Hylobates moloch]